MVRGKKRTHAAGDSPGAEVHRLDTGRFAQETHATGIAALMRGFVARAL